MFSDLLYRLRAIVHREPHAEGDQVTAIGDARVPRGRGDRATINTRTALVVLLVLLASVQAPHTFVNDPAFGQDPGQPRAAQRGAAPSVDRNSLGMRFVEIPAGSFDMGSRIGPGEQPVHRVTVRSFWMGVTEVTQAQWQAVTGRSPSHFKQAGPDAPVEMVSWDDTQVFIARLNALEPDRRYRLPSEAEWEYACRAGTEEDPYGAPETVAWIKENSGGTTHPVGLKRPNAFGLHDMFGNVSEWCQDTWHADYNGAPTDGSAWEKTSSQYHTLRGGGWDLPAFFIHAALRGPYDPIHRLGLRLVCVPFHSIDRGACAGVHHQHPVVPNAYADVGTAA